ncbi:hypothetical protein OIU76_001012 [Salix suchowensis]|nr:hypothetical protein OIU76_001012 [Salix suchowensis]
MRAASSGPFNALLARKGHPKPVLSKGWLAFARHKELKNGDRVKFLKEKHQIVPATPLYRIETEREIKIFGVIFGYSPIVAPFHERKL